MTPLFESTSRPVGGAPWTRLCAAGALLFAVGLASPACFAIDRIVLEMRAAVPGIDQAKFDELAQGAKAGCPVSKALGGVPEITLKATLRR